MIFVYKALMLIQTAFICSEIKTVILKNIITIESNWVLLCFNIF